MGKKKPQKTKEISVAIAEASSTGDETQQPQIQTPRKRGRPRKIISGNEETKEEAAVGSQSKKAKSSEVEEKKQAVETKEEEKDLPRRSSRRKSKPRKSS